MQCPACSVELLEENINIQTDVARCHACKNVFKISEQVGKYVPPSFDITKPPEGVMVNQGTHSLELNTSLRSFAGCFLVPFSIVWGGLSLGGIYGTQIVTGEWDIITTLFGIPFVLVSFFLFGLALLSVFGRTSITLDSNGGTVFTGIGNTGYRRSFLWNDVQDIFVKTTYSSKGYPNKALVIQAKKKVTMGSGLKEDKLTYFFNAVYSIWKKRKEHIV